jgi:hypothetical protein
MKTHRFYLWLNGKAEGPFTLDQLRGMWKIGRVNALTQVCIEGDQEWTPLEWMEEQLNPKPVYQAPALTREQRMFESAKNVKGADKAVIFTVMAVVIGVVAMSAISPNSGGGIVFIIGLLLMGLIYFLPAFIAQSRQAENLSGIVIVNLLLGWTGIGYLAALIWACADRVREE